MEVAVSGRHLGVGLGAHVLRQAVEVGLGGLERALSTSGSVDLVAHPSVFADRVAREEGKDDRSISIPFDRGWLDEERVIMESLGGFKRAGADGVLTYFAPFAARCLAR